MPEDQETTYPAIDYAARRQERRLERASVSRKRHYLLVAAAVAALVALAIAVDIGLSHGRIYAQTRVAGVSLGGMDPDAAERELRAVLPSRIDEPVVIRFGDKKWKARADQIGLEIDYEAAVARAMRVGRGPGVTRAIRQRLTAHFGGTDIDVGVALNQAGIDKLFDKVAKEADDPAVDSRVVVREAKAQVIEGQDGVVLDRDRLQVDLVREFLSEGTRDVTARTIRDPMRINPVAAREAAEVAGRMLKRPVTVVHDKREWVFEPEEFGSWIIFRKIDPPAGTGSAKGLSPSFSASRARGPVAEALGTDVGRPPRDARFRTAGGEVTIVPSETGVGPDMDALARALDTETKDSSSDCVVELQTTRVEPDITTEEAREMGIKERIGTYTTTYAAGNLPRVNNIHLLGDSIDGHLIEPGATFSFNEAAGERTAAKGYQEAPAIVNGKLVPQLGGGVCQVGTTIFNAVFNSGLPVTQRRNHSFYIDHYPKGRDATVSWGGPDFKFVNDTGSWVLVSVAYTSSSITISLYGTDPGLEVESTTSECRDVKPFKTEEIKDKELEEGKRVVEDSGVDGKSITVKRIVKKDGKVVRTDTFVSVYKPKTEVVRVGTRKDASEKDAEPGDDADKPASGDRGE